MSTPKREVSSTQIDNFQTLPLSKKNLLLLFQNKKSKFAKKYILQLKNENPQKAQKIIKDVLYQIFCQKNVPTATAYFYGLAFYKNLILSAQLDYWEDDEYFPAEIHDAILSICEYNGKQQNIQKKGENYFVNNVIVKKNSTNQNLKTLGASTVMLAIQILQCMADWYKVDYFTQQQSRFVLKYQQLIKKNVVFPKKQPQQYAYLKQNDRKQFELNYAQFLKNQQEPEQSQLNKDSQIKQNKQNNSVKIQQKIVTKPETIKKANEQKQINRIENQKSKQKSPQKSIKPQQNITKYNSNSNQQQKNNNTSSNAKNQIQKQSSPIKNQVKSLLSQIKQKQKVKQLNSKDNNINKVITSEIKKQEKNKINKQKQIEIVTKQKLIQQDKKQVKRSVDVQKQQLIKQSKKSIQKQKVQMNKNNQSVQKREIKINIEQPKDKKLNKSEIKLDRSLQKLQQNQNPLQNEKMNQSKLNNLQIKIYQPVNVQRTNLQIKNNQPANSQQGNAILKSKNNLQSHRKKIFSPRNESNQKNSFQNQTLNRVKINKCQKVFSKTQYLRSQVENTQTNQINYQNSNNFKNVIDSFMSFSPRLNKNINLNIDKVNRKSVPKTQKKFMQNMLSGSDELGLKFGLSQNIEQKSKLFKNTQKIPLKTLSTWRYQKQYKKQHSPGKQVQNQALLYMLSRLKYQELNIPFIPEYFSPVTLKMVGLRKAALQISNFSQNSQVFFNNKIVQARLLKPGHHVYVLSLLNVNKKAIRISPGDMTKTKYSNQIKILSNDVTNHPRGVHLNPGCYFDIKLTFKTHDLNFKFLQFILQIDNMKLNLQLPITLLDQCKIYRQLSIDEISSYKRQNGVIYKSPVIRMILNELPNFMKLSMNQNCLDQNIYKVKKYNSAGRQKNSSIIGCITIKFNLDFNDQAILSCYVSQSQQSKKRFHVNIIFNNTDEDIQNLAKVMLELLTFLLHQ